MLRKQGAIVKSKRGSSTQTLLQQLLSTLTRAGKKKSSQYGDKMILRVIKDFFFYLSNLWTRFEGVDNLTAFDSVMLKRSFFSWRSLLESELL